MRDLLERAAQDVPTAEAVAASTVIVAIDVRLLSLSNHAKRYTRQRTDAESSELYERDSS